MDQQALRHKESEERKIAQADRDKEYVKEHGGVDKVRENALKCNECLRWRIGSRRCK